MKLYTINMDPSKRYAAYKDYLYELEGKINSLQSFIEWHNPNWIVLNGVLNKADKPYYSPEILINNKIIGLSLFINSDGKISTYTVLKINKLKLHKGLLQQYGENCYYWPYKEEQWPGGYILYSQLTKEQREEADKWYQDITHSTNTLPNDFLIWTQTKDLTMTKQVVLSTNHEYYTNICLLYNAQTAKTITLFKNNEIDVLNYVADYKPILAEQGKVIFCTVLEENQAENEYSADRQLMTNYKILPAAAAGSLYIPHSNFTKTGNEYSWGWSYTNNGSDAVGTNILFHLPGPHMRLLLNNNATETSLSNYYKWNNQQASLIINGYNIAGNDIKPVVMNYQQTTWSSFEEDVILHHILNDNYEEILFDESIEWGNTNFANYKIPRYIINIENMKELNSVLPSFNMFVTIV